MCDYIEVAKKYSVGEIKYDLGGDIWGPAFEYLLMNKDKIVYDKCRVQNLWTEYGGHLRNKIKNDELVLSVLMLSLPGYHGTGLFLYRGECKFLFESNKIGFCWTPKKDVAEMFARGLNAIESGGVLLKAFAPEEAILSGPNYHSVETMQEFEYTCNPKLLEKIEVLKYYDRIA